jgi:hypothetical protein
MAFKRINYQKVTVPVVGDKGVIVDQPQGYLFFHKDSEGGIVVNEEGKIGGGGYPYVNLRRNTTPTDGDMRDLIEHQAEQQRRRV